MQFRDEKASLTLRVLGAKFNSYFPRSLHATALLKRSVLPLPQINTCFPVQTSLCLPKTVTQNGGKVSVVFLLIIAYRPLIQSTLLNLAERLAGEDVYRVLFMHNVGLSNAGTVLKHDVVRYCTACTRVTAVYPVDHRLIPRPACAPTQTPPQKKEHA